MLECEPPPQRNGTMQKTSSIRPVLFSEEHLNMFKDYCQGMVVDKYGREIPITAEMIDAACEDKLHDLHIKAGGELRFCA